MSVFSVHPIDTGREVWPSIDVIRAQQLRRYNAQYPCVCVIRETSRAVLFGRADSLALCWIPRTQFRFCRDEVGWGERPDRPDGVRCRFPRWRIEPTGWARTKLASAGVTDC